MARLRLSWPRAAPFTADFVPRAKCEPRATRNGSPLPLAVLSAITRCHYYVTRAARQYSAISASIPY